MGQHHEDGYSADVEGFLIVSEQKYRLAKTNGCKFVLADVLTDGLAFPPGTIGELAVTVDGRTSSRLVNMPDGVVPGQATVRYKVEAPF